MKYLYLLLPLLFSACSTSTEKSFNFDESKTIVDLLSLPGYESLNKDEQYKTYISDYFESRMNFYKKNPELIALMSYSPEVEQNEYTSNMTKNENAMEAVSMLPEMGKWFGKGILATPGFIKDGVKMVMLDKKKEKLHAGFSDEKKAKAKKIEKQVDKIIAYYNCFFDNEVHAKIPYKYLKPSLKEDTEVMKLIEQLFISADRFFVASMEVKTKVALNYYLSENQESENYKEIVDYAISIFSSGGIGKVNIDTPLLNDYFNSLNDLSKSIQKLENAKFNTSIEDWSVTKRASYEFSIKNIKEKTLKEIKSINKFDGLK